MKRLIILSAIAFLCSFSVTSVVKSVDKDHFVEKLNDLEDHSIVYDPSYCSISFPNGDVPKDRGVCSDVVIRAFMNVGVSLQKEVYNYRKSKGLSVDKNIDHRRVRNLGAYFSHLGLEIDANNFSHYYKPGDIIWWKFPSGIDHIGIVTSNGKVIHNIGRGQRIDVSPTAYPIHKAYRLK